MKQLKEIITAEVELREAWLDSTVVLPASDRSLRDELSAVRFRPSPTEQLSSKLVLPMVPFTTSLFTPTPPPTTPPVSKLGRITPFCFSNSAVNKHKRHQDSSNAGGRRKRRSRTRRTRRLDAHIQLYTSPSLVLQRCFPWGRWQSGSGLVDSVPWRQSAPFFHRRGQLRLAESRERSLWQRAKCVSSSSPCRRVNTNIEEMVPYMSFGTCALASQPKEKTVWNCKSLRFSSSGRFWSPDAGA